MARTSPPEKLRRITTFLYGLTNEEVQRYLNDFGMSVQEIDVGWGLFQEAVRGTPQARRQLTNSQAARTHPHPHRAGPLGEHLVSQRPGVADGPPPRDRAGRLPRPQRGLRQRRDHHRAV